MSAFMQTFIFWFVTTIVLGGWLIVGAFWNNTKMTSTVGKVFISIILLVLFGSIIGGMMGLDVSAQEELWNNGKCKICSESLHFVNASRSNGVTHYFYLCDNCGNIVETTINF